MKMAIAVEPKNHPRNRTHYRLWYLEFNDRKEVIHIGVISREELIRELLADQRTAGKSNWRAMLKDRERSIAIDLFDFIGQGIFENTHFGNLPTLCEFQEVLNQLQTNLEVKLKKEFDFNPLIAS